MPAFVDPEGVSVREIQEFVDLQGKRILEIGCGEGRLTIPLAETASSIIAIDPVVEDITIAIEAHPEKLKDRIDFIATAIEDYELPPGSPRFDLALFTWSL